MKLILKIVVLSLFSLHATQSIQAQTRYTDYFVSNKFIVDDTSRFQVFKDKSSFESIFHPAAVMKKQRWVNDKDFDSRIFVAVMKETEVVTPGKTWTKIALALRRIRTNRGTVTVDYTLRKTGTTIYSSCQYLLYRVNTDKSKIKRVVFRENGKVVRTITL